MNPPAAPDPHVSWSSSGDAQGSAVDGGSRAAPAGPVQEAPALDAGIARMGVGAPGADMGPVPGAPPGSRPGTAASPLAGSRGDWLDVICPYLRAADGTWRSASPAREHRCWALEPIIELPGLTQQRLCLTQAHAGCERFLHAQDRRAAALARDHIAPERMETARFGPFVSALPLAVERSAPGAEGSDPQPPSLGRDRVPFLLLGGAAIVILLAAAVVFFGGFVGSSPRTGLASPTLPAATAMPPTPSPSPSPSPTPSATLPPSPSPAGPTPTATPLVASQPPSLAPRPSPPTPTAPAPSVRPIAGQRYRVKDGDKLTDLAVRFGVTVRAIKLANDLGDPPVLVPGSFIIIPNPVASPPA